MTEVQELITGHVALLMERGYEFEIVAHYDRNARRVGKDDDQDTIVATVGHVITMRDAELHIQVLLIDPEHLVNAAALLREHVAHCPICGGAAVHRGTVN